MGRIKKKIQERVKDKSEILIKQQKDTFVLRI